MKEGRSDRRALLDDETEVKPAMRRLVEEEFRRGASIPEVWGGYRFKSSRMARRPMA